MRTHLGIASLFTSFSLIIAQPCVAKEPDERYANCAELVGAARDSFGLREVVFVRDRKPFLLAAAGLVLAIAAGIAAFFLSQGGSGPAKPSTKPTLAPKVDSLQRIDPKTNKLVATIGGVGSNPTAIAVGAGNVWVGSQDDGTVSRVDPKTNAVRGASVKTGAPVAIVIRDGRVLVANQFGSPTSIDPATLSVSSFSNAGYGSLMLTWIHMPALAVTSSSWKC